MDDADRDRWWPTTIRELIWEGLCGGEDSRLAWVFQRLAERLCRRFGHAWAYRSTLTFDDRRDGESVLAFKAVGRACKRCLWFHVWTWDRHGVTQAEAERHACRHSSWPVKGTYWMRAHDGPPSDLKEDSRVL